jgi:hypothetical protein
LRRFAACGSCCSNSDRQSPNVFAPNHSSIPIHWQVTRESRVYQQIQTGTNHCSFVPNGARLRCRLLSPQVSRSPSPSTAGARKGLFYAVLPELLRVRRFSVPWQTRSREIARAAEACALRIVRKRAGHGGGAYTSSDPPPPAHRCSSTSPSASGVEPTSRSPPPPPPPLPPQLKWASRDGPFLWRCFGSLSGSHTFVFADPKLPFFWCGSVRCMLRRIDSILSGFGG